MHCILQVAERDRWSLMPNIALGSFGWVKWIHWSKLWICIRSCGTQEGVADYSWSMSKETNSRVFFQILRRIVKCPDIALLKGNIKGVKISWIRQSIEKVSNYAIVFLVVDGLPGRNDLPECTLPCGLNELFFWSLIIKIRVTLIKYEDFDVDIISLCILLFIIYYILRRNPQAVQIKPPGMIHGNSCSRK